MARRRRGVRVLKWLGTGLCVLIAAAFVISGWHSTVWMSPDRALLAGVSHGAVVCYVGELNAESFGFPTGCANRTARARPLVRVVPEVSREWYGSRVYATHSYRVMTVRVPLWLLFLALLLPTLLLWCLDRRRPPPGHCPLRLQPHRPDQRPLPGVRHARPRAGRPLTRLHSPHGSPATRGSIASMGGDKAVRADRGGVRR